MHFVASGLHFDSVYWVCMDYVLFCGQCASVICYACLGYVSLEISCCVSGYLLIYMSGWQVSFIRFFC